MMYDLRKYRDRQVDIAEPPRMGGAMSNAFVIRTPVSIGAAIRHYRQQAGLTQEELASLCGLNATYIITLENGDTSTQVKRILRVLKELGLGLTITKAGE